MSRVTPSGSTRASPGAWRAPPYTPQSPYGGGSLKPSWRSYFPGSAVAKLCLVNALLLFV